MTASLRLSLSALLILSSLASSLQAAVALKPVQVQTLSQVYLVDRKYKSMEGPSSLQPVVPLPNEPAQLIWVTGFKTEIVGEDGQTPMSPEFMCHINLDMGPDRWGKAGWKTSGNARLFTLSQAQFEVKFPEGFGMPMVSNEPLSLATQVLNHNFENANYKVRHKVTLQFVKDSELKTPLKPLFPLNAFNMRLLEGKDGYFGVDQADPTKQGESCLPGEHAAAAGMSALYPDAQGRKFSGHWVVKPGVEKDPTNVTRMMNVPYDTTLHYVNIHLHPFAESIELYDLTAKKTVFKSRVKNPKGRIGLERIETFSSKKGVPLYKDHEYSLISVYNNTSGKDQDAMATMFFYLLDKQFKKPTPEQLAPVVALPASAVSTVPLDQIYSQVKRVRFRFPQGSVTFKLYPKAAPQTVAQVVSLVKSGAYDGTPIQAILKGFVVQISDVSLREKALTPAQSQGIHDLPLELSALKHRRGSLTMSRDPQNPNGGRSSFSVLYTDAPHLDGQYAVFGEVEKGMDVLTKMGTLELDSQSRPATPLRILEASVLP